MESEELRVHLDCAQTVLAMMVWIRPPEDQQDIIQGLQELTKARDNVFRHSDIESVRRTAKIERDFYKYVLRNLCVLSVIACARFSGRESTL